MKDFSKWVDAWNTYNHPPTKQVPRTVAELSANEHSLWVFIAIMCIFTLASVILHCLEERSALFGVLSGIFTVFGLFLAASCALAVIASLQPMKTVTENVPRPASFITQVEKEFGVSNLSCPPKDMDAIYGLPDKGMYQCSVTYGEDDVNLRNLQLVVSALHMALTACISCHGFHVGSLPVLPKIRKRQIHRGRFDIIYATSITERTVECGSEIVCLNLPSIGLSVQVCATNHRESVCRILCFQKKCLQNIRRKRSTFTVRTARYLM